MRVAVLALCLGWVGCGPGTRLPPAAPRAAEAVSPQDRFVDAAGRGDFGEVDRRLYAGDVAIDGLSSSGITALLAAIEHGEAAMAKRLLSGGASAERMAADRHPLVASAEAAVSAELIAAALLAAGAEVEALDGQGRRALVEHARRGHLRTVRSLIAGGADPGLADGTKATALHAAAGTGQADIVELLLAKGAAPDAVDDAGASALFHAAAGGHVTVLDLLLQAGAEATRADATGRRPLGAALAAGHHDAARALLQAGQDPNAVVWPPEGTGLHVAAARDDVSAAAILEAAGAELSPATPPFTPLMAAARGGRIAMVRWLLSRKASVSPADGEGRTVLHIAASAGQATIAQILIEAGADPERRTDDGRRAIDLARASNHDRVVEVLARP